MEPSAGISSSEAASPASGVHWLVAVSQDGNVFPRILAMNPRTLDIASTFSAPSIWVSDLKAVRYRGEGVLFIASRDDAIYWRNLALESPSQSGQIKTPETPRAIDVVQSGERLEILACVDGASLRYTENRALHGVSLGLTYAEILRYAFPRGTAFDSKVHTVVGSAKKMIQGDGVIAYGSDGEIYVYDCLSGQTQPIHLDGNKSGETLQDFVVQGKELVILSRDAKRAAAWVRRVSCSGLEVLPSVRVGHEAHILARSGSRVAVAGKGLVSILDMNAGTFIGQFVVDKSFGFHSMVWGDDNKVYACGWRDDDNKGAILALNVADGTWRMRKYDLPWFTHIAAC